MSDLYPDLLPFFEGFLPERDGHCIFYQLAGRREGIPALIVHGGPGSGSSAKARRYFDPNKFLIIQFDQRNCGRSLPHGSRPSIDLSANTTHHLLDDMERLRAHLNVEKWLMLGGSWGATLALAYAQRNPQNISAIVLNSIATTTRKEINWITKGVSAFFPREWHDLHATAGQHIEQDDLVGTYYKLTMNPDPAIHQSAADAWCRWEMAIVNVTSSTPPHPRWMDPEFRLCFARLVTHVWHHRAWLQEDQLLHGIKNIADLPARLIHGRLDFGSPLKTAWDLHRLWPSSRLHIVETAGHDARDDGMADAIMSAVNELAGGNLSAST